MGFNVVVESGAGSGASFSDEMYKEAGATIADSATTWKQDLILKVRGPTVDEAKKLKDGARLISFLYPGQNTQVCALFPRPSGIFIICLPGCRYFEGKESHFLGNGVDPSYQPCPGSKYFVLSNPIIIHLFLSFKAYDALSSMANIAGYKAVLEATNHFGRHMTGQITGIWLFYFTLSLFDAFFL
jgi:NAD(P) transhydrogenase subunit alpha